MDALDIELKYARSGQNVREDFTYTHTRSDAGKFLVGRVAGEALTGLSATFTARMIMPNGSVGPAVIVKESSSAGEIDIVSANVAVSTFSVNLVPADTSAFQPGQAFVFDVEFKTTTTPAIVQTLKGRFALAEDYTLNNPSPSPSPSP